MSTFKVGDKVRIKAGARIGPSWNMKPGDVVTVGALFTGVVGGFYVNSDAGLFDNSPQFFWGEVEAVEPLHAGGGAGGGRVQDFSITIGPTGGAGTLGAPKPEITAPGLLTRAAELMAERGKQYDKPEGERSMGKAVAAFNAITGRAITEAEGWLLLQVLKDVRLWQRPGYHADSAEDCVAYGALKAEAKSREAAP